MVLLLRGDFRHVSSLSFLVYKIETIVPFIDL